MNDKPSIDRSLLAPALIGVFSLLGIIIVLLIGQLSSSRAPLAWTETPTPFKFLFLGTEPGISTEPSPEESLIPSSSDEPPAPTEDPAISITPNRPKTPTKPNTSNTLVPSPTIDFCTPTSAAPPPLNPGTYDDTYKCLTYSGDWNPAKNVSGAEKGTLHISDNALATPGNSIEFRFIGLEARLFFLPGPGLGVVQIMLDGKQYLLLDQSNSPNERPITATTVGTHTVKITHVSGGSGGTVNLDFVIIPSVPPTPTRTPRR